MMLTAFVDGNAIDPNTVSFLSTNVGIYTVCLFLIAVVLFAPKRKKSAEEIFAEAMEERTANNKN